MQFCWVSFLIGFGSEKRPEKDTQKKQGRFKPWVVFINGDFTCGLALRCIVHGPQAKRDDEETSPKVQAKRETKGKTYCQQLEWRVGNLNSLHGHVPAPEISKMLKNAQKCSYGIGKSENKFILNTALGKPKILKIAQFFSILLKFAQKVTFSHFISPVANWF